MFASVFRAVCRSLLCSLPLLSAGRASAAAEPFPGLDGKWRHYQTANFELLSRISDRDSREMLTRLETMRAFFLQHFEWQVRSPAEVTIYCFGSREDFKTYIAPGNPSRDLLIGEYRPFLDRDVISLSDSVSERTAMWIVYSNYTKHLLNAGSRNRVSWLYQGLGLLLGNFETNGSSVVLGQSDDLREKLARQNPQVRIEDLMQAQEGLSGILVQDQANIFHAQAWAVLHYLYCFQTDVSLADVNRFVRFLMVAPAATDPARRRSVFEEIFKIDCAEMDKRLHRYLKAGRFRAKTLPAPKVPAIEGLVSRKLDVVELRERLAELKLRTTGDDAARMVLREALDGPRATRAAEALGDDAARTNDDRQASAYWQRALAGGSANRALLHLLTQLEYARWFSHWDFYFRMNAEKTAELRAMLAKCLEVSPDRTEPLEVLAWVESAAAQPSLANVNLVQRRFAELAQPSRTLLAIALIHSRLGDHASALSILDQLPKFGPGSVEQRFAVMVRPLIEERLRRAREAAGADEPAAPTKP